MEYHPLKPLLPLVKDLEDPESSNIPHVSTWRWVLKLKSGKSCGVSMTRAFYPSNLCACISLWLLLFLWMYVLDHRFTSVALFHGFGKFNNFTGNSIGWLGKLHLLSAFLHLPLRRCRDAESLSQACCKHSRPDHWLGPVFLHPWSFGLYRIFLLFVLKTISIVNWRYMITPAVLFSDFHLFTCIWSFDILVHLKFNFFNFMT